MRARQSVLFSLCASILAISAACSDAASPILGPDGPVGVNSSKSVVIAPNQATLSQGSHVALRVTSAEANGQPVSGSIAWSSSDTTVATVSKSGDVIAVAPGQAVITASVGDAKAHATVEVSGSNSAGPSDPVSGTPTSGSGASGLWTNEPSGLSTLTDQHWTTIASQGWQEFDPNSHISTVADPNVPNGDANVLQFAYPKGFSGGGYGPGQMQYHMSKGEIYIGFYWKLSPNWQGHTTGVNKLFYLFQREGENREAVFLVAHGAPGGPYHLEISNEASDGGRWWTQNVNDVALEPGQWYKVEMHLRKSSSDAAPDGLVEWWVNGQLAARYPSAKLRGANFSEVHIDPVWGGRDDALSKTHDDYERFGSIHVSGR